MRASEMSSSVSMPDIRQIALCEAKGIQVPKNAKILHYGCGAGRRVYQLLDAGYKAAIGYDVLRLSQASGSFRPAAVSQQLHPSGLIPLPDASVDFVFSDQVFEHVSDQPRAWRGIYRVLKPGGVSVQCNSGQVAAYRTPYQGTLWGLTSSSQATRLYCFLGVVGVRNPSQHGLPVQRSLAATTTTLIRASGTGALAGPGGCPQDEVGLSGEELAYMQASRKPRIQQLARVSRSLPAILPAIRTFWVPFS